MILDVKTLKKILADHPDDMEVHVDFATDYDGNPVEKRGPADDCVIMDDGKLIISAKDAHAKRW